MKKGTAKAPVTPAKAREILRDGMVHGRPLTPKQEKFFGRIAGGAKTVLKSTRRRKK